MKGISILNRFCFFRSSEISSRGGKGRLILAVLFALIGLAAVQGVFLLLQERQANLVETRLVDMADENQASVDSAYLNSRLSELMRFGLIRCFQVVEADPVIPPDFPDSDCAKKRSTIFVGSVPIQTLVTGAARGGEQMWALRFEVLPSSEFYAALWAFRALVLTVCAICAKFPSRGKADSRDR